MRVEFAPPLINSQGAIWTLARGATRKRQVKLLGCDCCCRLTEDASLHARESLDAKRGPTVTKAIQQSVRFAATPEKLFEMYLDSKQHSASTGGRAKLSRKPGGKFTAWNEQLRGHNLLIIPNRMIVQAWRSTHWKASESDSILILEFSEAAGGAQVDLVHVNVPQHDHKGVRKGWPAYYWKPWKKYLAGTSKAKLTAADEVDDFEAVVRLDLRVLPVSARKNIEVALDGDAAAGHAQMIEQCDDVQAIRNFAALAVNCNDHICARLTRSR